MLESWGRRAGGGRGGGGEGGRGGRAGFAVWAVGWGGWVAMQCWGCAPGQAGAPPLGLLGGGGGAPQVASTAAFGAVRGCEARLPPLVPHPSSHHTTTPSCTAFWANRKMGFPAFTTAPQPHHPHARTPLWGYYCTRVVCLLTFSFWSMGMIDVVSKSSMCLPLTSER